MRKFLLFAGKCYYPSGGADDFQDSFDTLQAAKDAYKGDGWGWAHVAEVTDDAGLVVRSNLYESEEWTDV